MYFQAPVVSQEQRNQGKSLEKGIFVCHNQSYENYVDIFVHRQLVNSTHWAAIQK